MTRDRSSTTTHRRTGIAATLLILGCLGAAAFLQRSQRQVIRALATGSAGTLWLNDGGRLSFQSNDGLSHHLDFSEMFVLTLRDGREIPASAMTASAPSIEDVAAVPSSTVVAARSASKATVIRLTSPSIAAPIVWRVIVQPGATYWRQELTIGPAQADIDLSSITLVRAIAVQNHPAGSPPPLPEAHVAGTAQGSPAVVGPIFVGLEHPMSTCRISADPLFGGEQIDCSLARALPLRAGQSVTVSAVLGAGIDITQVRRAFNAYIEQERVHPYRPFLHYNSWYDLGYFTPYTEQDAVGVIDAFGRELVEKRHVALSSFLFDDGWDSHTSLWSFNSGFPNGFAKLKDEAAKFGAAPGVWMSPFGGYGQPRTERLTYGKQQGFETNERGFALSGPVYYARFRDVCLEMMSKYGINQFKFDGIGRATGVVAGSQFGSDFEAAIHLIRDDLRAVKPDVFVNLTTGTWPSPFWLQYADTIWRGGEDHSFAGVGSKRQQWITYRDGQTYRNVVQAGPLFPLSSLMLHGLIYARDAKDLNTDPGSDFRDEVRSYFGTGTELQEMYITPALLSAGDWDAIAEAAAWARANADILVDTHWIGGDPLKLEVYGHAAWTPRGAIVVLRNPSDKPASFDLDVARAFELGRVDRTRAFQLRSPWAGDKDQTIVRATVGRTTTIVLKPFEVLTLQDVR